MSQVTIQQAFDLALQHLRAGRLGEAEGIYRQILAVEPKQADALHFLGVIASKMGRYDAAVDLIGRAIAFKPNYPEAYNNLGNVLKDMGRVEEAIAAYRRALACREDFAEVHSNLSTALRANGQWEEAIVAGERAVGLRADFVEGHNNLGNALRDGGRWDEAVAAYRRAIALEPNYAEAYYNLGEIFKEKRCLEEAMGAYERAIGIRPDFLEVYVSLSKVLREVGRLEEAVAVCQRGIAIRPDWSEGHSALGMALSEMGERGEAIAECRRAVGLRPELAEAHGALAYVLLLAGNYLEGWKEYEWRMRGGDSSGAGVKLERPRWDGSDLAGRTILVYAEQGLGDVIQFVRYVPLLVERGGKVVLKCSLELRRVLGGMEGVTQWVGEEAPARFDVYCPLLSLPGVFGTTVESVPWRGAYVRAEEKRVERWRREMAGDKRLKVGLVWAGNPKHANDRNRSIGFAALGALGQVKGVSFYSLQKGEAGKQLKERSGRMEVVDWTEELKDFADTAGLVANLDLVICVDTAVAHLAGAMGKAVWTLLPFAPDWRWMMGREESAWYPTMRLFRQASAGDWEGVIRRVGERLAVLAADGRR